MELQNTVKEALNALYHHPDDTVRMQADRYLQEFQRTLDAWQVLSSIQSLLSQFVLISFPSRRFDDSSALFRDAQFDFIVFFLLILEL